MNKLYVCEQRGICAGLPDDPVARLLQAQYRLQRLCRNLVGPIHATPPTIEWFAQTFDIPSPFQNGIPKGCDEITYLGFKVIFDEGLENGVICYDENWTERKTLDHAKEEQRKVWELIRIIRCKNYKYFHPDTEYGNICAQIRGLVGPEEDDFCSYGEEKTGRN
jgi:hypothetical protein